MAGKVEIKFTGDSADLRAELQKVQNNLNVVNDDIQGMTNETRKALDSVSKGAANTNKGLQPLQTGLSKSGKAAKQTGKDAQLTAQNLDQLRENAGETASIMGGLATSLAVVSPQAGAVVASIGNLATGLEAAAKSGSNLFRILTPVGVAVAAAGAAYVALSKDLDQANERLKINRDRLASVLDISRKVKEATLIAAHAELAAAEATGKATKKEVEAAQAELDRFTIAQQANDLFATRTELLTNERDAIAQKITELKKAETQEKKTVDNTRALNTAFAVGIQGGAAMAMAQRTIAAETKGNNKELKRLESQLLNANKRLETHTTTVEKYKNALQTTKDSQEKIINNSKKQEEQQAKESKKIDETAAALEFLKSVRNAAFMAQLDQKDQLFFAYDQELEKLEAIKQKHKDNDDVMAQLDAAKQMRESQLMQDLDALREEMATKEANRQQQLRDQNLQAAQTSMNAIGSTFGSLSQLHAMKADEMSETDKEAARKQFETMKSLAVAETTVNYAMALMAAFRDANLIAAGLRTTAATAAFALSMARINATEPSFHTGTSMVRAPGGLGEMNARLRQGEAVATPLGAEIIGRTNIERANAGMHSEPQSQRGAVFQYEHRVFSQFIRDNVRTRGPLGSEQDKYKRIGRRA